MTETAMQTTGGEHHPGIEILGRLAGRVVLPRSEREEQLALEALLDLQRRSQGALLDGGIAELMDAAKILIRDDVRTILDWIEWDAQPGHPFDRSGACRSARMRLLFILLALVVARDQRFRLLALLAELGALGGVDGLDELLRDAFAGLRSPGRFELAGAYLDLTGEVLVDHFEAVGAIRADMSVAEFERASWPRRLMELERRLVHWQTGEGARANPEWRTPGIHAHTLEFRLARSGAFGRLERAGGAVAARRLAQLRYRDHDDARHRPVRWRRPAVALLLGLIAVLLAVQRLRGWEARNLELADRATREATRMP